MGIPSFSIPIFTGPNDPGKHQPPPRQGQPGRSKSHHSTNDFPRNRGHKPPSTSSRRERPRSTSRSHPKQSSQKPEPKPTSVRESSRQKPTELPLGCRLHGCSGSTNSPKKPIGGAPFTTSQGKAKSHTRTAQVYATQNAAATPSASQTPAITHNGGNGMSSGQIAAAVVVPIIVVGFLILGVFFWRRRRRQQRQIAPNSGGDNPQQNSMQQTPSYPKGGFVTPNNQQFVGSGRVSAEAPNLNDINLGGYIPPAADLSGRSSTLATSYEPDSFEKWMKDASPPSYPSFQTYDETPNETTARQVPTDISPVSPIEDDIVRGPFDDPASGVPFSNAPPYSELHEAPSNTGAPWIQNSAVPGDRSSSPTLGVLGPHGRAFREDDEVSAISDEDGDEDEDVEYGDAEVVQTGMPARQRASVIDMTNGTTPPKGNVMH